ncbi:hypothetical protein [Tenacibaculum geojense]|uniref:Lipoprotein n=1 Tax=Tenacibaculum geojense TaxID=915352 RepID=A0ABW3JQU3_9FLAO
MKFLNSLIFFTLFFGNCYSQKKLEYEKIKTDILNSSESLNTTFLLPSSDFFVAIIKDSTVDNPEMNPCVDIESNKEINEIIIKILKSYKLLETLYIEIDYEKYESVESKQKFIPKETELYIELFFKSKQYDYISCFVPVFNKNIARKIVADFGKLFECNSCFKKLKRKI